MKKTIFFDVDNTLVCREKNVICDYTIKGINYLLFFPLENTFSPRQAFLLNINRFQVTVLDGIAELLTPHDLKFRVQAEPKHFY